MKVSGAHGGALLTGDIERETEARLVEAYGAQLASDALVVPHHAAVPRPPRTSFAPLRRAAR
ncbi:hypothetical protein [Methylogaea oryzae]|uniref:hypothetical protein n=1 Tax=Methylogaea oryzae TaxID=1295382 RepID=UPI00138F226F|nr:hypothetical protein [Methylogaea oryzae]